MRHNIRLAGILVVALLPLCLISCDLIAPSETPAPASQPTRVATPSVASVTETVPADTPSVSLQSTPVPTGDAVVLTLQVADVPVGLPPYNRDDWRHWRDDDRDCQDARQEVLVAESLTPVEFNTADECRVLSGSWIGPYTGTSVDDPGELDVDHMVPLANAHRSGGWAWDRERKAEYANSLDYDDHLIATTSAANRAKGSDGPEDWRPPAESYWCEYAIDWITIKNAWGLTATAREAEALSGMLQTCPEDTVLDSRAASQVPVPPLAPVESTPAPSTNAPSGTQATYESCDDAQAAGEPRVEGASGSGRGFPQAMVPSARDGDGDGVVCER